MKKNQNKKSFKMPIIILIVVLAILLIGGVYLYLNQRPKEVYTKVIDSFIDKLGNQTEEIKTLNASTSLGINISNSSNKQMTKIAKYLNKAKVTLNMQLDNENEKVITKLGLDYDNDNLINAKLSYKNNEDTAYGFIEELFDKNFALSLDSDMKNILSTIFNETKNISKENDTNSKKAISIIKKSISSRLKDEYFSQEDAIVKDIDGKEIKAKKSMLKLTEKQFQELFNGIIDDLNKDEFINCFEEEDREDIKSTLNDLKEQLSEINASTTEDEETLSFVIYTKGITSKFVKFETESKEYNVGIYSKEVDKNTTQITVTSDDPDIGNVRIDIQLSIILNKPIEDMDTSNSVKIEELTQEDYQKITQNLQNMRVYKLIQEFVS